MYNVRTNIAIIATVVALTSCGPSEAEKRHNAAQELAAQIESAIDNKNYVGAIELIDSLNATYPDEVELRKTTLLSRARAMEGMIMDSIPIYDEAMTRVAVEKDSLDKFFVDVHVAGLDGYRVDRGVVDGSFSSHTTVQPRLGDEQIPWTLAVNVAGRTPRILGMRLTANGTTLAEVMAENVVERRVTGYGSEMFSFGPEEAWQIADALNDIPYGAKAVLVIVGEKGNVDIAISEKMRTAIERTSRLARLKREDHNARVQRELLERKLIVARDQIANFTEAE